MGTVRQAAEISRWLVRAIARHAQRPEAEIDPKRSFGDYGLASADAVALAGELEEWLGQHVSPTAFYEHASADALARALAESTVSSAAAPAFGSGSAPVKSTGSEPVAIVGMACRVPGGADVAAFWRLLTDGVDAISEVPADRWSIAQHYDPELSHPEAMNSKWGGFLGSVAGFDAEYFGISEVEAASMDPQQRLLLELAVEAIDDAGASSQALRGSRTGVFIGISGNDYERRHRDRAVGSDVFFATSNALSIAANRISYLFDLRGPSLAIDTACSSSLVAVHQACRSLVSGECSLALVGGVNLILSPDLTISFSQAGATSRDGRCRAFDASANGIVRGEGGALVVLKTLSRALADRDRIYAVIRGSAVNQDGKTNGLTAPSGAAQRAVLAEAYHNAGIDPSAAQYVEAHGTGTQLGDPIEATALGAVFGQRARAPLAIGSVKSNIGHLEAAAGVVSLLKVALALRHQMLPPSLHFQKPNPYVDFPALRLAVQCALAPWHKGMNGRVAGVSAFGFGGTNAHVVLKEAPAAARKSDSASRPLLAMLSAKTAPALQQRLRDVAASHANADANTLLDLAYTSARQDKHAFRAGIGYRSREELLKQLHDAAASEPAASADPPKIVFVFGGHGVQWWGMGRELCQALPEFRRQLMACSAAVAEHSSWNVFEELQRAEVESRIASNLDLSQLATFTLHVALARTWAAFGVRPHAVLGHSMGEVAAAHVAGILSLEDAARLIAQRSRLLALGISEAPEGAMALARLSPEDARELLSEYEGRVSIAAHNAPKSVVLSGDRASLVAFCARLEERRVVVRMVDAPGAGHSPAVEPARAQLVEVMQSLQPRAGDFPFISTVTGGLLAGTELGAAYWGDNLRKAVLFATAVEATSELLGKATWLELGASPLLCASVDQTLRRVGTRGLTLASLKRDGEVNAWLGALGKLFQAGGTPDLAPLFEGASAQVSALPSYPWQRKPHWLPASPRGSRALAHRSPLGERLDLPLPGSPSFWQLTQLKSYPRLAVHRFGANSVVALSTLLDIVGRGYRECHRKSPSAYNGVRIAAPVSLQPGEDPVLQLLLFQEQSGASRFQLFLTSSSAEGRAGAALLVLEGDASAPLVPAEAHAELGPLLDLCCEALLRQTPARALLGWQAFELTAASAPFAPPFVAHIGPEPGLGFEVRNLRQELIARMSGASSLELEQAPEATGAAQPLAAESIEAHLLARIAVALGVQVSALDANEPLSHLGIDSVTALQLKNNLELELGISIPLAKLLEAPTVRELSVWAVSRRKHGEPPSHQADAPSADDDLLVAGVEHLTPAELDALLGTLLKEA